MDEGKTCTTKSLNVKPISSLYIMDIAHNGMESRIHYEVSLFSLVRGFEDLTDSFWADNYKDAVKKAKEWSHRDGITHTEVIKNVEFYYSTDPDTIWDTQVEKRWMYAKGKLTGTSDY